jgi:hypothetical protein
MAYLTLEILIRISAVQAFVTLTFVLWAAGLLAGEMLRRTLRVLRRAPTYIPQPVLGRLGNSLGSSRKRLLPDVERELLPPNILTPSPAQPNS